MCIYIYTYVFIAFLLAYVFLQCISVYIYIHIHMLFLFWQKWSALSFWEGPLIVENSAPIDPVLAWIVAGGVILSKLGIRMFWNPSPGSRLNHSKSHWLGGPPAGPKAHYWSKINIKSLVEPHESPVHCSSFDVLPSVQEFCRGCITTSACRNNSLKQQEWVVLPWQKDLVLSRSMDHCLRPVESIQADRYSNKIQWNCWFSQHHPAILEVLWRFTTCVGNPPPRLAMNCSASIMRTHLIDRKSSMVWLIIYSIEL